jgi:hypothetical protein
LHSQAFAAKLAPPLDVPDGAGATKRGAPTMQRAPILALLACLALAVAADAAQSMARAAADARHGLSYFVEFRARGGEFLGHAFVVYGRTDRRGDLAELHRAGLYPRRAYEDSLLLALLVVPARLAVVKEDLGRPPTAVYHRRLNASQYAQLTQKVRRLQMDGPAWHLILHNCNSFLAEVARTVGLATPPTLQRPADFVRGLAMLNER